MTKAAHLQNIKMPYCTSNTKGIILPGYKNTNKYKKYSVWQKFCLKFLIT